VVKRQFFSIFTKFTPLVPGVFGATLLKEHAGIEHEERDRERDRLWKIPRRNLALNQVGEGKLGTAGTGTTLILDDVHEPASSNVGGWEICFKFRFLAGKLICKRRIFQHATFDYRRVIHMYPLFHVSKP